MSLLSERDRQTVQSHLAGLTHDVTLLFFTQTIAAPETALIARQVVDEVAGLSDRVSVEEVNLILDREKSAQYGIDRIPAIVLLRDGADTRMRFLGAPAGYEFTSLIQAVLLVGGRASTLSPESLSLVAAVDSPLTVRVFTTPTCPHCPRAVSVAHEMAFANPNITAYAVEATEFPDLARRYHVTGVPKTVVNDAANASEAIEILGALPPDDFVSQALAGFSNRPL